MARFDVYPNPGVHAANTPYLLDVQSGLLDGLDTRVVVPLRRLERYGAVRLPTRLTPVLEVDGQPLLLETPKMGAVPSRILKAPVATLADRQTDITAALDFLFHGY